MKTINHLFVKFKQGYFYTKYLEFKVAKNFRSNFGDLNFESVRTFVVFLGNSRSGTTLIRSIIDRHPEAIIGHELGILKQLTMGRSWDFIFKLICLTSLNFNKLDSWQGRVYSFSETKNANKNLKVLGNKKAYAFTKRLTENKHYLSLLKSCPIQIKFIRCVRNPFDVISRRQLYNKKTINENISNYFDLEDNAEKLLLLFNNAPIIHLYLEEIIENPIAKIKQLFNFLDLETDEQLISEFSESIDKKPLERRKEIDWSKEQKEVVKKLSIKMPHLKSFYFKDGTN